MSQWNRNFGYDVELEDDNLYPQRSHTTTRRYIPLETRDAPQRAVTRPRRQEVKRRDKYDEVNIIVRRTSAPRQKERTRPHAQTATQDQERERRTEPVTPSDDEEEPRTEPPKKQRRRAHVPRFHWLVWVGIGMLAVVVLWIVGGLVVSWWSTYQDDLHYGRPRTYQTDARVGHYDAQKPSHFIAINLHGQTEVIEFPGGDPTKAKVYLGPSLSGQTSDLDIVTVSFKDLNGDGKPDMILIVDNMKYPFLNDNGAFRPPHADEHINV